MNTVVNKIEQILTSEYSTANFVELMQEIFDSMKLVAPNNFRQEFSNFSTHIAGKAHVGNYTTPEGKKISIFSVQLKKESYVESSRSTQRSYAKKLIEGGNCDAAIVAFYTEGEPKWRLSFVRLDYEMKIEQGKLKATENLTPAKRYSFLVGKDEPSHTAIDRFRQFILDRNANPSLDELEEAFSVEKVTKEFFELYCEKFYQLQEYLDSNEDFVEESQRCGFTSEQFAKKLLGQIVFLYFLQKKGWLGVNVWAPSITEKEFKDICYTGGAQGRIIKEHLPKIYIAQPDGSYRLNSRVLDTIPDDEEEVIANHMVRRKTWGDGSKKFLRTIFEHSKTHKGHFFENYLEPLFYDTLNRNRGSMGYCPALHARVPFLSGGLFEPLDSYDWKSNHFDIPDEIFSNKTDANDRSASGILDIFDRYNFTMSEDEPMEREVAIDPEMLGKIFENLLEIRDRKSKGAFYTPREIVHYMCQESLVNYLIRKTGLPENDLRDFILYGDFMKDEDTVKAKREGNGGMLISPEIFKIDENGTIVINRLKDIDDALASVRVADPAVGSGAFPLGMVNEIVRARENITAYITIGMNANKKRLIYKNERSPYALKFNAIRNSIFAVDIEPSAVDITQLRLWLSLVIDDEITPDAANDLEGHKNPLPLPNLECNILCGNSLIDEFMGIKLVKESDLIRNTSKESQLEWGQDDFEAILRELLSVQDKLFVCDEPNHKQELKAQLQSLKNMIVAEQLQYCSEEIKAAYAEAVKMNSKPFTLWHLDFARVFRDHGGFDIVIGNPPYFNIQTMGAKNPVVAQIMKRYADIWMDKSDILFYFVYLGYLISNSQVCYITSNAYLFSNKAKRFRDFIVRDMPIERIINFENYMVFDSASITSCITQFNKIKTGHQPLAKVLKENSLSLNEALYNAALFFPVELKEGENFQLIRPEIRKLDAKIKSKHPLLGDILKVGKGMETAANDVFLFDEKPDFPEEYLRYRVTGEMINKYHLGTPTEYLLYYEGVTQYEQLALPVRQHLEKSRDFLQNRATVKNEGRDWWRYSRPMHKEYYNYDKIWCSYRGTHNAFAYDTSKQCIGLTNTVAIFDTNEAYDILYILALVNSKLLEYQHKNNAKQTGGGVYEYVPNTIERYPIVAISKEEQQKFVKTVRDILKAKQDNPYADISAYEDKIDEMVYALYGLTTEEIALVEAACK